MKVCLDTNAYSNLRRGNVKILEILNDSEEIIVPVAATALDAGARLVSYDHHFDAVAGLIRLAP